MTTVGIDVAKASLAVTLLTPTGKARHKRCPNTTAGHAELLHWLGRQADGPVHVGLEATGGYQDAVALTLHDAGHTVSVLNPAAVEAYGRSQLRRAKTDPTECWRYSDGSCTNPDVREPDTIETEVGAPSVLSESRTPLLDERLGAVAAAPSGQHWWMERLLSRKSYLNVRLAAVWSLESPEDEVTVKAP